MRVTIPSLEILTTQEEIDLMIKRIEQAGRICYRSEDKITEISWMKFLNSIVSRGHESVIEHAIISVKLEVDRGVSHELVRHRVASYSQSSTRYCNYSKGKFGNEIAVIKPCFWITDEDMEKRMVWHNAMKASEDAYFELLDLGATPQEARSVLPNSLKTEIIVTMNLRSWRNFFQLRTNFSSHPQMIEIATPLLKEFKTRIPVIFDDIKPN